MPKYSPGDTIEAFELTTLRDERLAIPDANKVCSAVRTLLGRSRM